jgi:uncharacterized protein YutE (UPF0331/DUF86 family)
MVTGFRNLIVCKYIDLEKFNHLNNCAEEIGKLLNHMIINPEKYK